MAKNHPLNPGSIGGIIALRSCILEEPPETQDEPSRILIDTGWKDQAVRAFISQHPSRLLLVPTKGKGIGPADTPMSRWSKKPGEKLGDYWHLGSALESKDKLRLLQVDVNAWKDRVCGMLTRPRGERGGVLLWGDHASAHELLALHLSSEFPVLIEARGAKINAWKRHVNRENHMFDTLVGCCVAASLEGLVPPGSLGLSKPAVKREKVSFAAMHAEGLRRFYEGR